MKNKLSTLLLCLWGLGSAVGICIWKAATAIGEGNFVLAIAMTVLFLTGSIFGTWLRLKIQTLLKEEK